MNTQSLPLPLRVANHNQTVVRPLPIRIANHNQTIIHKGQSSQVAAPWIRWGNHNQTVVRG